MAKQTYVERIGSISLSGGVVRIDFTSACGDVDGTGRPSMETCSRLAMTLPDFLKSFAELSNVAEEINKIVSAPSESVEDVKAEIESPNFRLDN